MLNKDRLTQFHYKWEVIKRDQTNITELWKSVKHHFTKHHKHPIIDNQLDEVTLQVVQQISVFESILQPRYERLFPALTHCYHDNTKIVACIRGKWYALFNNFSLYI